MRQKNQDHQLKMISCFRLERPRLNMQMSWTSCSSLSRCTVNTTQRDILTYMVYYIHLYSKKKTSTAYQEDLHKSTCSSSIHIHPLLFPSKASHCSWPIKPRDRWLLDDLDRSQIQISSCTTWDADRITSSNPPSWLAKKKTFCTKKSLVFDNNLLLAKVKFEQLAQ